MRDVYPIPGTLPVGAVLRIAGVEICRKGQQISKEEIERRVELAFNKVKANLPRIREELGLSPLPSGGGGT